MKVLMISTDRKIFEEESEVRKRMEDYGVLFDELHVIVVAEKRFGFKEFKLKENVWVYPSQGFNRLTALLRALFMGEKIVKPRESWVVSAQDPFEVGLVGWWVAFYGQAKLQLQIHTDLFSPYFSSRFLNKIRVQMACLLLPKADCVRVVSERVKRSLAFLPLKTEPIVLPISSVIREEELPIIEEKINLKKKYPQFGFIVLMASRLEPEKNIFLALGAFKEALSENNKLGMVIVGSGSEKAKIERWIKKENMSDFVILEGWQENLRDYYRTADLYLLSSNFEGYSRSLVEAALNVCPILSTDVGLIGEFLNKNNCLICPVGDRSCLKDKLFLAASGRQTLKEMAEQARKSTEESLPTKKDYLSLYRAALEKGCGFSK